MTKFRADNTQGYNEDELEELNRCYEARIAKYNVTARAEKSVQDHVAERVLADFDSETAS